MQQQANAVPHADAAPSDVLPQQTRQCASDARRTRVFALLAALLLLPLLVRAIAATTLAVHHALVPAATRRSPAIAAQTERREIDASSPSHGATTKLAGLAMHTYTRTVRGARRAANQYSMAGGYVRCCLVVDGGSHPSLLQAVARPCKRTRFVAV